MKKQESVSVDFPIDLVYMWVDGRDPKWLAKRQEYGEPVAEGMKDATTTARWRDNGELRFSLRSVEMYAPWINHIFIITDSQCPEWLDTNNPKITIVDHKDILPHEALPLFNSQAIESCLYRIENLSEHFIVANDDTMFVKPCSPSLFFHPDGTPVVRLTRFNRRKALHKGMYQRTIRRMQDMVNERFDTLIPLAPHHNFDAYRKSYYKECVETCYHDLWRATSYKRFRDKEDMQRCFVSYYMIVAKGAQVRKVGRYNRIHGVVGRIKAFAVNRFANDSRVISSETSDYNAAMRKYNPLMVCFNDNEKCSPEDCDRLYQFLTELFPKKSSFEL